MGSVISWFYEEMMAFGNWLESIWQTLVFEEQRHPYLLAIAAIIVLTFLISLIINFCACIWSICCSRTPQYNFINPSKPNNYGTIQPVKQPGESSYPYNPAVTSAPGPSKKSVNVV